MAKKIILTIGHGTASDGKTYDSGALSKDKKYQEFKIAKEIGKYAQKYYNEHFSEQCDLMNYDGKVSLQERINRLKDDTYDFIAEIHLNAGGGTGTECYYHHQSERGRKYADAICKNIASALDVKQRSNGTDDGGDKTKLNSQGNDYFGIIRSTKPCAVLVETVFIDNDSDLAKVKTAAGQKKCGEAIAKAIASVRGLKESKKETTVKAETKSKFPYKVKINIPELNVRAGAGTQYKLKTTVHKNEVYTIVAEKDGWGQLLSGAGWLKLSFTKKV